MTSTPTPWVRAMSVERAAWELRVGMVNIAEWVVQGRLRARVAPGSERPTAETVLVCAVDVSRWRRDGLASPVSVEDPRVDHFQATVILGRKRSRMGWPPKWPGMPDKSSSPKSHPNPRRMGMTDEDRVREVNAMVRKLSDGAGWSSVAVVCRHLAKRDWGVSDVVRGIVDDLIGSGVLEERVFRPRVGRPSRQVRFVELRGRGGS